MATESFWIRGVPATFATRGEKPWREAMVASAPHPPEGDVVHRSLEVKFVVPRAATGLRAQDPDNLMEPVLSALVGRLGWFGGRRRNIDSWAVTIRHDDDCGAHFLIAETPHGPRAGRCLIEGTLVGSLPSSATHDPTCVWAEDLARTAGWTPIDACGIELEFSAAALNIGEIATGPVKSTIDCLYPLLGGVRGAPEDQRVRELLVRRGVREVAGAVRTRLFALGHP